MPLDTAGTLCSMSSRVIAALAIGVAVGGVAVAVALDAGGDGRVTVVPAANETPVTTEAAVTTTPDPTTTVETLASGFEDYTPGGELPAPPPAPNGDTPPATVLGPNGPIYPDGYSEGPNPTPETRPPAPPPVPGGGTGN